MCFVVCITAVGAIIWRGERRNSLKPYELFTIRKVCKMHWLDFYDLLNVLTNQCWFTVCTYLLSKIRLEVMYFTTVNYKPQNRGVYFSPAVIASSLDRFVLWIITIASLSIIPIESSIITLLVHSPPPSRYWSIFRTQFICLGLLA